MMLLYVVLGAALARATPLHPPVASERENRGLFSSRGDFSPRMDYDEWTPLGRGDPLKNDPTYDYVPPVLERVHYWMDPSKRTPDPPLPNSGVLILGSTPPTKEPTADSRIDTMSLLDPFLKLMDVSKFGLGLGQQTTFYTRPTQPSRVPPTYQRPILPGKPRIQALQRPPYTMLMPPPPPPELPTSFATSTTTTEPSVTTTTTTKPNATTTDPAVLANTENVYKPVAISLEPDKLSLPEDTSMILPIISMFNHHKKDIHEHEVEDFHEATPEKHPHLDHFHHHNFYKEDKGFRPTTLRTTSMTTDPMFKHYKQPSEPVKGPFYLIIQGHSKVKTYGASKNPINGLVSNEIKEDEDDGKSEYYDMEERDKRRGKKLNYGSEYDLEGEIVEGNPVIEMSASFKTGYEDLEDTFGKTKGGNSKKRYLVNTTERRKRSLRRLLEETEPSSVATELNDITRTSVKKKNSTEPGEVLDEQLGLESLIAFSDDYNSEDVVNLLLKEEGALGSGLGGFVSSIFARSVQETDEM